MSTAAPVWFDAMHVGDVLVGDDGRPGFAYCDAWLATGGAFPLSVTMPLRSGNYPADIIGPWEPKLARILPMLAENPVLFVGLYRINGHTQRTVAQFWEEQLNQQLNAPVFEGFIEDRFKPTARIRRFALPQSCWAMHPADGSAAGTGRSNALRG